MTGKNTIVLEHMNPDCRFYTKLIYVNFHFNKKIVFITKNGNVKLTCFRDVVGNTIVIRQAKT